MLQRLDKEEDHFFLLESRGLDRDALEASCHLLRATAVAATAEPPGSELRRYLEARTVVALFRTGVLASQCGVPEQAVALFGEIAEGTSGLLRGIVESEIRSFARRCRPSLPGEDRLQELDDRAGFLKEWMVIGPFDNERGSGFERQDPPERGFDPDASVPGKVRAVSWRSLPFPVTDVVDLGSLFQPREQCLAYALTSIFVEEEREVAFRIGSDEGVKLWVDGEQLLSRDARRRLRLDQDSVGVRLSPGWHTILVKVTQREGPWGFLLRVTETGGEPLAGIRVSADPAHLEKLRPEPGAALPAVLDAGPLDWIQAWIAGHPLDARAHLHQALLLQLLEPDDEGQQSAHRAALRALELSPGDPSALFHAAITAGRTVGMLPEIEENRRRSLLEKLVQADPSHVRGLVLLARYHMHSLDIPTRSLELLDRAIDAAERARAGDLTASLDVPTNLRSLPDRVTVPLVSTAAYDWMKGRGFDAPADELLSRLAMAEDWIASSPETLARRADTAARAGRLPLATEIYTRLHGLNSGDPGIRSRLVETLRRQGKSSEALSLVREAVERDPYDVASMVLLASIHESREEDELAVELFDRVLVIQPENAAIHAGRGEVLHRLSRDDEARVALRRSLELDPGDNKVRRYVDFLEKVERNFHDDFPVDVGPLIAAAQAMKAERNEPYRYLLRRTIVELGRDGRARYYEQLLVKVLNDRGIREFDVYPVDFAASDQDVRVLQVRVTHPDGSETPGSTRSLADRGRGGRRDERQVRRRYIDVPPLTAGDVIEIAYRIDDRQQSFFGDAFGHEFLFQERDLLGVEESTFILIAPEDRQLHFHRRHGAPEAMEVARENGMVTRRWTLGPLAGIELEVAMPPAEEVVPSLQVSTYASWDELASWWWNLVRRESQMGPEMEETVAELRGDTSGASELLRAFYGFVVQQIRYVAWEFGVHGYQPYNVSTILARRFGDCKDKAILLNAMLGGVGVEGYPVLLFLGNVPLGQDLTLPMVNHFNHCISYVPGFGEGGIFLDGTAEFHGSTELPGADSGRLAVVVREGRAEIHAIPEMLPRENQTTREFTILLSASSTSRIEGKIRATGDFAAQARQQFLNPEKSPAILESTFSDLFGSARLRTSRFFDARDLESSPEIVFDLDVQGIVRESGAHLETPALLFPVDLSPYVGPESRRFDLVLPPPQRRLEQTTFVLPEGARLLEVPVGINVEESFGSYRLSFERQGERDVRVTRDLSLSVRRIPAADYPAFRSFCLLVGQGEERRLRFQVGQ